MICVHVVSCILLIDSLFADSCERMQYGARSVLTQHVLCCAQIARRALRSSAWRHLIMLTSQIRYRRLCTTHVYAASVAKRGCSGSKRVQKMCANFFKNILEIDEFLVLTFFTDITDNNINFFYEEYITFLWKKRNTMFCYHSTMHQLDVSFFYIIQRFYEFMAWIPSLRRFIAHTRIKVSCSSGDSR